LFQRHKEPAPPSTNGRRAASSISSALQRHPEDVAVKGHAVVDEPRDIADSLAAMDLDGFAHEHQTLAGKNRVAEADVFQAAESHELPAHEVLGTDVVA